MILAVAAGCSGSGAGSELAYQARPTLVADAAGGGSTLHLPRQQPFSIVLSPSREEPGLGGTAHAEAVASGDGQARTAAQVGAEGSAQGTFQLGHALSNQSARQVDLSFSVRFAYEYSASLTPQAARPDAKVSLTLYARDGRNRLLVERPLITHSTEQGAVQDVGTTQTQFTLTLGPDESVSVFLAGQAQVQAKGVATAQAQVAVTGLEMDVTTHVAPPVGATTQTAEESGDGQP